ncbi:MAG TPA: Hachiman antiphage defense system protein HamA [Gemmataceae bacterium]|nr:Hachiman antiphage defense system protein HamA [Gemmataceae bacterium]
MERGHSIVSTGQRKKSSKKGTQFILGDWMDASRPDPAAENLVLLQERNGSRGLIEAAFRETVKDHLAGLSIIHRISGYKKSLAYIRNKMPRPIRVRSGDCGEILATEYIEQCTRYHVPIKRLRWKDDRDTTMRGDDVIALRKAKTRWHVLKTESKSREVLTPAVILKAIDGLDRNAGRPNPSSLAFISARLRELNHDDEADVFDELQAQTPRLGEIEHMVFTLSGNNPTAQLKLHMGNASTLCRRHLIGCVIVDHQDFINALFDRICAG